MKSPNQILSLFWKYYYLLFPLIPLQWKILLHQTILPELPKYELFE